MHFSILAFLIFAYAFSAITFAAPAPARHYSRQALVAPGTSNNIDAGSMIAPVQHIQMRMRMPKLSIKGFNGIKKVATGLVKGVVYI
ncbi:hypothetical protein F5887DRAFT_1074344 [Amanita rubescens]|nr:hypothetical protein F5887DRAFT_1074344 [Amanita rubescens]